ncbi:OmpA family protein [Flavobacterium lindanitolerans]|jgi:outer membrane protein OmpA-like peptidoglycan-associated protein/tetratricopeptide (TPR) repeat protein|uniref:OmpA family protein n=1 Tax=Flavobacterium lindanitolerans TaxID=428988 RepID=UPI0023F46D4C|nr:OmpA family protein [Flavobacterium lindanitolerans]
MKKQLYTALAVFSLLTAQAQEAKLAAADKQYEKYAYVDAIKTYERVAEKGYKSVDLFQKLGNAYYFNAELDKANKWYEELFAMNQPVDAEYYYRYSQTLKSVGDYEKANQMLAQFNQKNAADLRAQLYTKHKDYLEEIKANSGRYKVENININSEYSDYGTAFFGNKLVFTSARDTGGLFNRKHQWTNQSFTKLYASEISSDGSMLEPEQFNTSLNSKFNEATPVFTKDGKTVYFTRNNYNKGKRGKNSDKATLLKIYKGTLENGKWVNITELPFTSDNYSTAHPALSPDEKTLYFASDMPGTLGQSDLFKVAINADGSFGTPENLGKQVNTEGRETFPYITDENELYFASDGQLGLGGLDVFVTQINKDGSYGEIKNVGAPVNGPKDDFAFMIDTKTRFGFFSSNRDGGKGYDDIYKFQETRQMKCEQLLAGTITDKETGLPIANARVTLSDASFKVIKTIYADHEGKYSFDVECGNVYYVKAESKDYTPNELKAIIPKESGETDLSIELDKPVKQITVGTDLAKTFGIKIIYFDLDKWNIRPDAAIDLAKIVDVMKQYPNMKVDVRSHTDSRQTHKYNQKLSDRRAKSTVDWMVQDGIAKERITGRGYGETQLVNKCADGVECTEQEHQQNRRSEFIITAM